MNGDILKLNLGTNELVTFATGGRYDYINLIDGIIYAVKDIDLDHHQIVKIDENGNETVLTDERFNIQSMIAFGGNIYYALFVPAGIFKMDYNGQNKQLLVEEKVGHLFYGLSADDNHLYFVTRKLDFEKEEAEGSLYRTTLDGQNQEVVLDGKTLGYILSYNFDDEYIYYSYGKDIKDSENGEKIKEVRRRKKDGSSDEKIFDSSQHSLPVMDNIILFYKSKNENEFFSDKNVIFINTDGTNRVELDIANLLKQ